MPGGHLHALCQGTGYIDADDLDAAEGLEAARELAGFLEAAAMIERDGVLGCMLLLGVNEWDPLFVEALGVLREELGRLQIEEERERAEKAGQAGQRR